MVLCGTPNGSSNGPIANLAGMEDIVSAVVSFWAQANLE